MSLRPCLIFRFAMSTLTLQVPEIKRVKHNAERLGPVLHRLLSCRIRVKRSGDSLGRFAHLCALSSQGGHARFSRTKAEYPLFHRRKRRIAPFGPWFSPRPV